MELKINADNFERINSKDPLIMNVEKLSPDFQNK